MPNSAASPTASAPSPLATWIKRTSKFLAPYAMAALYAAFNALQGQPFTASTFEHALIAAGLADLTLAHVWK